MEGPVSSARLHVIDCWVEMICDAFVILLYNTRGTALLQRGDTAEGAGGGGRFSVNNGRTVNV